MTSKFWLVIALLVANVSGAQSSTIQAFEGYVTVASGISLYARVTPGQASAPVIVLLNGLTQDMDHWDTVVPYLQSQGATVVNIDLALQGRSMEARLQKDFSLTRPVIPPLIVSGGIWDQQPTFPTTTVVEQSNYVSKLLVDLGIHQPVVIAGLSYGGGLALQMAADHPDQLSMAILAAPYVFPLPTQDQTIQELVTFTKTLYPAWASLYSDETIYDLVLRGLVYTTYPQIEPEILKWSPPFESIAVGELVRGIRHMQYKPLLAREKNIPLHLIIAGNDQYIPRAPLLQFWNAVPKSIQGTSMLIEDSEHKMNEAVGPFFGAWIWQLASNPAYIKQPGNFVGVPVAGSATEQGGLGRTVQLPPTVPVETYVNPENWPFSTIDANPGAYIGPIISDGNPIPSSLPAPAPLL